MLGLFCYAPPELVGFIKNCLFPEGLVKLAIFCPPFDSSLTLLSCLYWVKVGFAGAILTLPAATGTLIGTGDTGTLPLAAMDIDGGTDIGGALETTDLIIVDDGAGGTNRKAALSRVVTLMTAQGFSTDDPTALAIALG